jgi:hypothetical protein
MRMTFGQLISNSAFSETGSIAVFGGGGGGGGPSPPSCGRKVNGTPKILTYSGDLVARIGAAGLGEHRRHKKPAPARQARCESDPTQRDRHLQLITEHGRMAWQKTSGYNARAKAEAAISRYKRVIGDALRSRTDDRQATEVAIAVRVLNRMLELGRPKSVRIA